MTVIHKCLLCARETILYVKGTVYHACPRRASQSRTEASQSKLTKWDEVPA